MTTKLTVIKVQLYHEHQNGRAILVGKPGQNDRIPSNMRVWIPTLLINHSTLNEVGSVGELEIPSWLYEKHEEFLIDCYVEESE